MAAVRALLLLAAAEALRAPGLCPRAQPALVHRRMPCLAHHRAHRATSLGRAEPVMQFNQLPRGGPGFDPRSLIFPAVLLVLLATGTLGFVFNLLNGFFLFLFVAPLIAGPLFNWWLSNNLLEGT